MTCPRPVTRDGITGPCGRPILEPLLWIADGRDYCSAVCAAGADNAVHTRTRNVPADRWLADQDARDEARREADRNARRGIQWPESA